MYSIFYFTFVPSFTLIVLIRFPPLYLTTSMRIRLSDFIFNAKHVHVECVLMSLACQSRGHLCFCQRTFTCWSGINNRDASQRWQSSQSCLSPPNYLSVTVIAKWFSSAFCPRCSLRPGVNETQCNTFSLLLSHYKSLLCSVRLRMIEMLGAWRNRIWHLSFLTDERTLMESYCSLHQ